ncbi:MAG: type III pantothenate kinase [candidate division KSB1 bacterium]|nr:type III pantothenate kinase [candidate division KSB1 bacterium]MDZ7341847.1 type III pantothenate kinase [candidate division KSB1 bacterium]
MLIVIDIGNTNVVIGIYQKRTLVAHWRLSSLVTRTRDEIWIILEHLLQSRSLSTDQIHGGAISSVVPNLTHIFCQVLEDCLKLQPVVVSSELNLGLKIMYEDPRQVGADRICNAIAGIHYFGGPLVILDFGTATTFDVISAQNEYLGGIIAPGIELTASILHQRAARLPKVELQFPPHVIGRNTESSIQSGLMFGTVELINGLIARIEAELGTTVKAVATGGLAKVISPYTHRIDRIEPFLTLDGLRLIFEQVHQ